MDAGEIIAVCGTPGVGKTALLPSLVSRLAPRVVVDLDEILEPGGYLFDLPIAGPAGEPYWAAYDAMWLRIFRMILRSGNSVVVLSQIPSASGLADPSNPVRRWVLLDCPDDVRRERLLGRGWSTARVDECINAAAEGRKLVNEAVCAGRDEPKEEIAERIRAALDNEAPVRPVPQVD